MVDPYWMYLICNDPQWTTTNPPVSADVWYVRWTSAVPRQLLGALGELLHHSYWPPPSTLVPLPLCLPAPTYHHARQKLQVLQIYLWTLCSGSLMAPYMFCVCHYSSINEMWLSITGLQLKLLSITQPQLEHIILVTRLYLSVFQVYLCITEPPCAWQFIVIKIPLHMNHQNSILSEMYHSTAYVWLQLKERQTQSWEV